MVGANWFMDVHGLLRMLAAHTTAQAQTFNPSDTIVKIRDPQNSIGNYLGAYMRTSGNNFGFCWPSSSRLVGLLGLG